MRPKSLANAMRSLSIRLLLILACGICFISAWLLQFASATSESDILLNQRAAQSLSLTGGYFGLLVALLVIRSCLNRLFPRQE